MIIVSSKGRLGNQLFQYSFSKNIKSSDEYIVALGFSELLASFDMVGFDLVINRCGAKLISVVNMLLSMMCTLRLITSIQVEHESVLGVHKREKSTYTIKYGLFFWVKYISDGYFQSKEFFCKDDVSSLKVKPKYEIAAREIIREKKAYNQQLVVIHVRRADYRNYFVYGQQTLLPLSYFHECVATAIRDIDTPYFLFLSDEPELIESEFSYLSNFSIVQSDHYQVDFSLLVIAEYLILSPSSFSWWGSYFNDNCIKVLSPQHWLGFKSGINYHSDPIPPHSVAVPVIDPKST